MGRTNCVWLWQIHPTFFKDHFISFLFSLKLHTLLQSQKMTLPHLKGKLPYSVHMIHITVYACTLFSQAVMEDMPLLLSKAPCSICGLNPIHSSLFHLSKSIWSALNRAIVSLPGTTTMTATIKMMMASNNNNYHPSLTLASLSLVYFHSLKPCLLMPHVFPQVCLFNPLQPDFRLHNSIILRLPNVTCIHYIQRTQFSFHFTLFTAT